MVKLIGDEVLYTAPDERAVADIAFELACLHRGHPRVPEVRAGLAGGEILLRDGDVFGPVVNLAARAVKVAGPGEVLAPAGFSDAAGVGAESMGPQVLQGLDEPLELSRLIDPEG